MGAAVKICLVPGKLVSIGFDDDGCSGVVHTCKGLDLLADHINASVVTGIELQHHLPHILGAIYTPR